MARTARLTGSARIALVAGVCASTLALGAGRAGAQAMNPGGLDRGDQIVLSGRLDVASSETVRTAAILNGPASIEGTVRETLFVLNGYVYISGTVGGDVVVVNGKVLVRSGAHIGGDVVTQTDPVIESGATVDGDVRRIATRLDLQGVGFVSRILWWIGYSVSTLLLGVLLLLLFPALDAGTGRVWRERPGEAVGFGVASFFLLPIVAIVFLVTIVGIPLGLFILLGLALVYTIGYVAGAHVLGRLIVKAPTSRFLAFIVGWAIARAVGLVPFLGGFTWLVASLVGLGVLVVGARRTAPRGATPVSPPPPPPPPAPVTAPA